MQSVKSVNIEQIRTEMKSHPEYETAMTQLAERDRGRFETTFRRWSRIMGDLMPKQWDKQKTKSFFEMMQAAGAGKIVFGANTPRFIWTYHMQSVACAVLGRTEPERKKKDGTAIPAPADLRKPSPQRRNLPRLADNVVKADTAAKFIHELPKKSFAEMITLKRNGIELQVDLNKITPDGCRKITDILLGLRDN